MQNSYKIRLQVTEQMASGNRISNVDIENFFENEKNDDLKINFMGVYSSNSITKYINFYKIIKAKNAKYSLQF